MNLGVDKRESLAREIAKIAGVTSLVISLIATVSFAKTPSSSTSEMDKIFQSDFSDRDMWDTSWVPTGFTAWSGDYTMAWKWTEKSDYSCQTYSCISVEFISKNGCPNGLYAALNWLDSSGAVISYSNENIPSLNAYQTAKLKFDDVEGNGQNGEISTISCR